MNWHTSVYHQRLLPRIRRARQPWAFGFDMRSAGLRSRRSDYPHSEQRTAGTDTDRLWITYQTL